MLSALKKQVLIALNDEFFPFLELFWM